MTQAAQVSNLSGLCCFGAFCRISSASCGTIQAIRRHYVHTIQKIQIISARLTVKSASERQDVCALLPGCQFGCFVEVLGLPRLRCQPNNLRPDAKSSPLGPMFQSKLCQTDTQNRCILMVPIAGLKGGLESGLCFKSPITMGLRLELSPQPMDIR